VFGLVQFTAIGLRIRAITDDGDMAEALGINTKWLLTLVFGGAAGLAAFAGALFLELQLERFEGERGQMRSELCPVDPGVDQGAQGRVARDPGDAIEVGESHPVGSQASDPVRPRGG